MHQRAPAGMNSDTTLVMLPGLDGTGKLFRPLLTRLHATVDHRIVAYPNDRTLSIDEMAGLVLEQLPKGPFVLLAESFSGLVALALLRRRPAAIRSVIFCAAFAQSPHPLLLGVACRLPAVGQALQAMPKAIMRPFVFGRHCHRELPRQLADALGRTAPNVLTHRLRLIAAAKAPPQIPDAIPCHYLQATRDRLVPARAAKWFARHFVPFHLRKVDGPHMLLQARPRECARLIAAICQG